MREEEIMLYKTKKESKTIKEKIEYYIDRIKNVRCGNINYKEHIKEYEQELEEVNKQYYQKRYRNYIERYKFVPYIYKRVLLTYKAILTWIDDGKKPDAEHINAFKAWDFWDSIQNLKQLAKDENAIAYIKEYIHKNTSYIAQHGITIEGLNYFIYNEEDDGIPLEEIEQTTLVEENDDIKSLTIKLVEEKKLDDYYRYEERLFKDINATAAFMLQNGMPIREVRNIDYESGKILLQHYNELQNWIIPFDKSVELAKHAALHFCYQNSDSLKKIVDRASTCNQTAQENRKKSKIFTIDHLIEAAKNYCWNVCYILENPESLFGYIEDYDVPPKAILALSYNSHSELQVLLQKYETFKKLNKEIGFTFAYAIQLATGKKICKSSGYSVDLLYENIKQSPKKHCGTNCAIDAIFNSGADNLIKLVKGDADAKIPPFPLQLFIDLAIQKKGLGHSFLKYIDGVIYYLTEQKATPQQLYDIGLKNDELLEGMLKFSNGFKQIHGVDLRFNFKLIYMQATRSGKAANDISDHIRNIKIMLKDPRSTIILMNGNKQYGIPPLTFHIMIYLCTVQPLSMQLMLKERNQLLQYVKAEKSYKIFLKIAESYPYNLKSLLQEKKAFKALEAVGVSKEHMYEIGSKFTGQLRLMLEKYKFFIQLMEGDAKRNIPAIPFTKIKLGEPYNIAFNDNDNTREGFLYHMSHGITYNMLYALADKDPENYHIFLFWQQEIKALNKKGIPSIALYNLAMDIQPKDRSHQYCDYTLLKILKNESYYAKRWIEDHIREA